MKINWDDVAKSVIATVISGLMVGGLAAYIFVMITLRAYDTRLSKLETLPVVTFSGHITGGAEAQAPVTIPQGQNTVLLISANGYGASRGGQFRASIVVRIEVDNNTIAREFVWIPQYVYDPVRFATEPKFSLKLTPKEIEMQRAFPNVATPIERLERMGPIELAASTSSIIKLDEGTHIIRAVCDGDDLTSKHVTLDYLDIRNAGVGSASTNRTK